MVSAASAVESAAPAAASAVEPPAEPAAVVVMTGAVMMPSGVMVPRVPRVPRVPGGGMPSDRVFPVQTRRAGGVARPRADIVAGPPPTTHFAPVLRANQGDQQHHDDGNDDE